MIKFSLRCANGHEFESWFKEGVAFDAQAEAGLISCPTCQSASVSKAIMAPALARRDRVEGPPAASAQGAPAQSAPAPDVPAPAGGPVEIFSAADTKLREMIAEFRQRVLDNSDDLGDKFAEEALKIHHGLAPDRPIHGQASHDNVRLLIEEGVNILPLPRAPGEFN
ncbi:protein of unknown function DUF1178 [Methylocella silvestris BL2]|uniref:DUF1178 domain-containing protein n=1 Tax=Methylocella silvestris (strain DSM 15510 / CIP 108128 / LMG 27833 / NCIMB 13906 / BL2) TaxID=395965 RepID=B8EJ81_METSB|nr:DUF1178 family protein [Methylocella silvestris]ACK52573.1 protein of unknown function DUF1178 [Methylocella silvestris BL2]